MIRNLRSVTWTDAGAWFVAALLLFGSWSAARGQELELVGGEPKTIKVEKSVITYVEATLVSKLPFTLKAPPGGFEYEWTLPKSIKATSKRNVLEVTEAAKGETTISVTWLLLSVEAGAIKTTEKAAGRTVYVGEVTPPDPKPDPKPIPTPDAAPYPSPGLTAMIVYETAESTSSLSDVMSGAKTNDYMAAKGIKGGFLKLDKDVDVSGLPEWAKAAFTVPRKSLPWLVISNSKTGYSGEVPRINGLYSPAATLELLKKHEVK